MLYLILKTLGYGDHSIHQIIQTNKNSNEIQNIFGRDYIITQFTNEEYINIFRNENFIKICNQNYEIFNI
jgi:hypothetical protein